MTTFEYLAVLISIIVGLGITQLLGGVARIVTHRSRYKLYWVHLAWTANLFLSLVSFWWFQLWLNTLEEWTYFFYLFTILFAVLLYLICAVIMPSDFPEDGDFRHYFFTRRNWFFGLWLALGLVDALDRLLKGQDLAVTSIGATAVYGAVWLALTVTAMLTKNPRFHGFFALFQLLVSLWAVLSGLVDRMGSV
jgi:hypothetical protein